MPVKPQRRKKGETLKEKVKRHLTDKNDKITEEDIRDAAVGQAAETEDDADKSNQPETVKEAAKEMQQEVPKNSQTTPWDILDEE